MRRNEVRIRPDDERLSYSGRIDWSDREAPVFVYPCTSVNIRFTGNQLKIHVENHRVYWNNYLGCILDGKQFSLPLPEKGEALLEIPVEQTEREEHEALFFKRQDACHEVKILGIELEDSARLLTPQKKSERRIEVYGDSVSAGEVSEAVDFVGCEDPAHQGEYSNSWYSYAWMTARKLHAEIHDIVQGGIALLDQTGWFCAPDGIPCRTEDEVCSSGVHGVPDTRMGTGMETIWDKIRYRLDLGKVLDWEFERYIPQLVIVALGQNDSHPEDYMKVESQGKKAEKWRRHYKTFLGKLRKVYPEAHIVCCTTLLYHDHAWDQAIGQVVQELKDERITQYLFRRNGRGTPGHLRIPEAKEMAEELSAYIESLAIKGWE